MHKSLSVVKRGLLIIEAHVMRVLPPLTLYTLASCSALVCCTTTKSLTTIVTLMYLTHHMFEDGPVLRELL